MNPGLAIFKNVQHLQEGVNNLGYDPSYPGPTNPKESGSGYWTQKGIGMAANVGGNLIIPGLGLLTGPLASWATKMLQSGISQNQVQKYVQQYQQQQGGGGTGGGQTDVTGGSQGDVDPTAGGSIKHPGVGIDPEGNPADPGEWWSNDFGRWNTDKNLDFPGGYNLAGPGGQFGTRGLGSSGFGGTVGNWGTAIGFGGNLGGSGVVDPSALGGGRINSPMNRAALAAGVTGTPFSDHAGYSGAVFSPAMLKQYPMMSGPAAGFEYGKIVNPAAFGGASSTQQSQKFLPRQQQQMGTSNVGLNLFRRKQMLKKTNQ